MTDIYIFASPGRKLARDVESSWPKASASAFPVAKTVFEVSLLVWWLS